MVHPPGQVVFVPLHRYGEHVGEPAYPVGAGVQVPGVALHTSQDAEHAVLQQYPSTQFPEAHAALRVHGEPAESVATQPPPSQKLPVAHPVSLEHEDGHAALPPPHR